MKEYTLSVDFKTNRIYGEDITLVQNDYNSTKFNFEFDSIYDNYTKVFELKYPSGKKWIKEIIDNEVILADYDENGNIIPILIESRDYEYEIVLYDGNSKLTHSATGTFYVREELVKTTDEEIELDDRLPILDHLIQDTIELKEGYETVVEQGNYAEEQGNYAKQEATKVDEIVDYVVKTSEEAKENSETAISISKGANQCKTYGDYPTFIEAFNLIPKDKYNVGQDIRIIQVNVPDLWVAYIEEESVEYNYITDEDFINELVTNGIVQVGYYKFGMLETQKVDLTEYVKDTDFATSSKAGVVKVAGVGTGIRIENGTIIVVGASKTDIDNRTSENKSITPKTLVYAVGSVKASETQSGTIKAWMSENEDGEIGLNISTEV